MACLELEYKNQPIKITNGTGSSEVSSEGQSVLLEFIQYGRLPQGYSIFWSHNGEEIQTDEAKRIFNEIIEDYLENKGKTLIKRYINMDPDTIDSYYANQDWSHSLYDTYLYQNVIGLQYNYWYMKDLGGKAIYGFTKNRPLKISGWQKQQANFIDDTLINSYCELRLFLENKGGNNFVYNTINQLYDKYYSPDESLDVYAKMTKLANNYLQELVLALYIPRSVKQSNNSEDLAKLLETPRDLKGLSTKYDSFPCVFTGKGDGTYLEAWKLSQLGNELIQIPVADVKSVYQTFTVHDKTGTYAIINKTWYKVVKSKYLPVDAKISEQLFNTWFGVPNDQQFEVINVYSASNPLNITSKIDNKSLGDGLPVGSYVRAAKGYYTKVSTGEFKNGEEVLSATDTIYQIYFNKKVYKDIANKTDAEYESILLEYIDPNSLKTVHVKEEKTLTLDGQQTKIVLYDLGVNNLSDIWFAFDSENVTEFLPSSSDKGIETTINGIKKRIHYKIGLQNVAQKLENIRRMSLGIQYYKALINDVMPDEIKENIREVFEYIVSKNGAFVQGLNLSEEAMAFISSFWTDENEGILNANPNLWGDILDENTRELAKAYYQLSDDSVSDKIQEDNGKVVCSIM